VHGVVESLFRRYTRQGLGDEEAFVQSVESITGPITRIISREGMIGVYNSLSDADKKIFETAYSASYGPAMDICYEIYEVRRKQRAGGSSGAVERLTGGLAADWGPCGCCPGSIWAWSSGAVRGLPALWVLGLWWLLCGSWPPPFSQPTSPAPHQLIYY
jgi:hypothetical protein